MSRDIPVAIFVACGAWLIGLGLYFALLRPALLPEDLRFVGHRLEEVRSALPGLEAWLSHVFIVMGGFMAGSGVLTVFLAVSAVRSRAKGTATALLLAGLATVVGMSAINFALDSDFKWLLLAPALLWLSGLGAFAR
jgi:ABC-type Na+ efflux pump permease subunit